MEISQLGSIFSLSLLTSFSLNKFTKNELIWVLNFNLYVSIDACVFVPYS